MLGRGLIQYIYVLTGVAAVMALILASTWVGGSNWPRELVFNISRFITCENTNIVTSNLDKTNSEHFIIKYPEQVKDNISLIASASEQIYKPVTELFGFEPPRSTLIVVYPDAQSLARSFGWDKDEAAMGVYWGGSIRILNPDAWITDTNKRTTFIEDGPMTHEFTHLIVDYKTRGNYTRWLTEGLAQYAEKKITGFEFGQPLRDYNTPLYYNLTELEDRFDDLDQGIAYWQCLKMVEYMVECYGEDDIISILDYLGQGYSMSGALKAATGQDLGAFERQVYNYLESEI